MEKNKDKKSIGNYEWMFSEYERQDGEKYDIHFLLNVFTGDVKKVVQKRIEIVEDSKEIIIQG